MPINSQYIRRCCAICLLAVTPVLWAAPSTGEGDDTVNINVASADELSKKLIGIGPTKAQAIVWYREKHQGFKTIDELGRVDGISPITLARLKPYVRLADEASKTSDQQKARSK